MGQLRPEGNDSHGAHSYPGTPPVDGRKRADIGNPLLDKVAGNRGHRQSEEILNLCGEDGQRNTRGEAHNYWVRDILDDSAQMKHTEHDEEYSRQKHGDGQALEAILLDDAINNNDERTRRATYLNLGTTED